MLRPRIYLAGPCTLGDRDHNYEQAEKAQLLLQRAGFAVLNPMLTMRLSWAWDMPHDEWIKNCLPWVAASDAVLRLPGRSAGADLEVAFATSRGIDVYHSIDDLILDLDLLTYPELEDEDAEL